MGVMTVTAGVLGRLELAQLIQLARTEPQLEYRFRHALVHDAAYESIAKKDRRNLHRTAGEILEALSGDRLDEVATTLAFHFERAGMAERAVGHQLRAADRAARAYANAEAIDFYRAALEGPAAETLEPSQRAGAHERFGVVLELTGQVDEAIESYRIALERVEDMLSRGRLQRRIGNAHRIARRVPEARAAFTTAIQLLDEPPDQERSSAWWSERIDLLLDRAWLHYFWGTFDEMRDVLDQCGGAIEHHASVAQRTRYHARLALYMARSGHMISTDEVIAADRTAYQLWRSVGDPTDAEMAAFQLGLHHLMRGDVPPARQYLGESLASAELTGDVVLQSRCLAFLALAARFAADPDEMERIHERAIPVIAAGGMTEYEALVEGNRCWAAWRRGDTATARRHGEIALELGRRLPARYPAELWVRLPLLAMALEAGDMERAIAQAKELIEGAWTSEQYGSALAAAIEADASGNVARARESLGLALEHAARIGWV